MYHAGSASDSGSDIVGRKKKKRTFSDGSGSEAGSKGGGDIDLGRCLTTSQVFYSYDCVLFIWHCIFVVKSLASYTDR